MIADIRRLSPTPMIELLYFDGCPNHEQFLPHLRGLLAESGIAAPITLILVDTHEEAVHHRFLGSPTLRINGNDVDPAIAGRDTYGLQCRLYSTAAGFAGAPPDQWILDALIGCAVDEAAVGAIHGGNMLRDASPHATPPTRSS